MYFNRCYFTVDSGCVFPDVDAPPLPSVLAPPADGNKPESDVKHKQQQEVPLPVVDEDDYLQPKSSNPAPYMDIIPDSKGERLAGGGQGGEDGHCTRQ